MTAPVRLPPATFQLPAVPPAHAGQTSPPAHAGQTSPPVHAGQTSPPAHAGPACPPTQDELADPAHARAWKAAQDFEAMALGALLQPMFDGVDTAHGPFGGGDAEATWRPMLTQQIASSLAHGGGLGLAAPVYRQMLRLQEQT